MAKEVTIRFRATASLKKKLDDHVAAQKKINGPDSTLTLLIENAVRLYCALPRNSDGIPQSTAPEIQNAQGTTQTLEKMQRAADAAQPSPGPRKQQPTPR